MATWRALRAATDARLREAGIGDRAPSEARWLVERVSGYEGIELVTEEDEPAPSLAAAHLDELVARRVAGEPLQYVLGRWSFLELDLLVDRRVLVPRPETEIVAQVAVEEALRLGARRGRTRAWAGAEAEFPVADLGTGSGALALWLATELADAEVWATDTSEDALAVARANLAGAGVVAPRVRLAEGSWFGALPAHLQGVLRVIVSNPPYVAEHEIEALPREVADWEPRNALVSGPSGLEAIEAIVTGAFGWLSARGGALVVELAPHQVGAAVALVETAGFHEVVVQQDLAGRDRVLVARRLR